MTRSADSDFRLKVESKVSHLADDGNLSSVTLGEWIVRTRLEDGTGDSQVSRALEYSATLTDGSTDDINVRTMAGVDVGAGAGNDALGQTWSITEIVALAIEHSAGTGQLEIMATDPSNKLAWVPTLSVANGSALKLNGLLVMYQPDASAFVVSDDTWETLRLTANGGSVTYNIYMLARHA